MKYADLNDKNFLLYAMRHYDNPQCNGIEEFNEDLSIPIHLKKLLTRYHVNGVLKERLIINHIISFFNVFDPLAAAKILFFKLDQHHYIYLKTFLVYLNRCPEHIMIGGQLINLNTIPTDMILYTRLKDGILKENVN